MDARLTSLDDGSLVLTPLGPFRVVYRARRTRANADTFRPTHQISIDAVDRADALRMARASVGPQWEIIGFDSPGPAVGRSSQSAAL